jgi:hypothetical protein
MNKKQRQGLLPDLQPTSVTYPTLSFSTHTTQIQLGC